MEKWVLQRYFGRQYLIWFLVFLAALSGVIYLFEVAELMRRASGRHGVSLAMTLEMGAYKLPETVERILPFVVLFSGLFTFWRLTRSQELIVARAVGVSAWQFVKPAFLITLGFAIVNITVLNPLGSQMHTKYRSLESRYFDKAPIFELTGAGLWLRQEANGKNYLLHADRVEMHPLTLSPVIILVHDTEGEYAGRIDAQKAVLMDGAWEIRDAWVNWDQQPPEHLDIWRIPTTLTVGKIQESMVPPNTISFWELPRFIEALKAIGLPQTRHEMAFQSILSQPLSLCAMILFAAAFSLRMNRKGGVTVMIASGVLLGIFAHTMNNVVNALGLNQTLPVILAAWAIPVVMLALGSAALMHMEES